MSIVYVVEQGVEVSLKGNRLILRLGGEVIRSYLVEELERLVLFGKVRLSPDVVNILLDKGIETVFLSYRGRYRGRLVSQLSKNVELRLAQYNRLKDEEFVLAFSKEVVYGKITNALNLLRDYNWKQRDLQVKDEILRIKGLKERMKLQSSVDSVRGIEGAIASAYFDALKRLVKNDLFVFNARTRRPPRDPANAVLSFLYTLLFQLVEARIYVVGLDPFVGFFHTIEFGKPSLALDLMEEFRPLMDRLFLKLSNRRMLSVGDFFFRDYEGRDDEHGVYLGYEGVKKVVAAFQSVMSSKRLYTEGKFYPLEGIILEQVRKAARSIREGVPYTPYVED